MSSTSIKALDTKFTKELKKVRREFTARRDISGVGELLAARVQVRGPQGMQGRGRLQHHPESGRIAAVADVAGVP